jgi:ABC-type transport system substrate-binding protein
MKFVVIVTILFLILGFFRIESLQSQENLEEIAFPAYVKAIYSMPVSYDPIKMNDGASLIFSELVYEGLLRFTEDYGIQPSIADSWSTSSDGLVLTFKINSKAKFHNGEAITAVDVKESLSRNVSPESLVYKFYDVIEGAKDYFAGESEGVTGIRVIDDLTIEIHLEKPFPPILYVLAGGTAKILPTKLIDDKDFFKKPIGSGPFKVHQISDKQIHLSKFSMYYGIKPKMPEIILKLLDQEEAMAKASMGLIHDLSSWPMSGTENVFKTGKDISSIVADTWIIGLNTRVRPFDSLETRVLFQQSIDTEKFKNTFFPDAKPAFGYIPPSFPGHQASKLSHGIATTKVPADLVTIYIPQELARSQEMADFFEDELSEKGWNIRVLTLRWEEMMKGYNDKSLQAFMVSMIVDYPDPEFLLNNFESTNPDNFSGIKDRKIDQLIFDSRHTQDRVKRQKLQLALAKRVDKLSLTVNLFHSRAHYWIHECVEGFKPNLLAVAYTDYRNVSLNQDCLKEKGLWNQLQSMK